MNGNKVSKKFIGLVIGRVDVRFELAQQLI